MQPLPLDPTWATLPPMLRVSRVRKARRKGPVVAAAMSAVTLLLGESAAHADLGSLGSTTIGLALSAGFQTDPRTCQVAGDTRNAPGTGCAMLVAGIEGDFLWRGRIGMLLGLSSTAGQANVPTTSMPGGDAPPAFPDRVSVVAGLDVRPLGFFINREDRSYKARLFHGLRMGIGPSLEIVRTALDSSIAASSSSGAVASSLIGMHALLDGEIPLVASAANSLSLRVSVRLLYVPKISLNDGTVLSQPFDPTSSSEPQGYGLRTQLLFGLAYYL